MPRILNDVAHRSQATSLPGEDWTSPFGIAPTGVGALTVYRGDAVLAEAARRANIPMIISGSSLTKSEQAAPRTWFQAHLPLPPTTASHPR